MRKHLWYMFNGMGIVSTFFIAIWSTATALKLINKYVSIEHMVFAGLSVLFLFMTYFIGKTYVEVKEWKKGQSY